jgi:peptidoglycan hydrolase-like protein with peptidoglycan-binding domain
MDSFKESLRRSKQRREKARRDRARRIRVRSGSSSLAIVALVVAVAGGGVAAGQTVGGGGAGLLKKGSGGSAVASVQRALGVPADGVFGARTKAAVRAFQARKGLAVDGIVGPQTRAALGLGGSATAGPSTSRATGTSGTSGTGTAQTGSLQRIARCESGGNPRAVGGGGRYRGKYQFSRATWRAVGGSGDPAAAPEAEQDQRAAALLARSGTSQWPVCGR